MEKVNLDIADREIREIVEGLKEEGFPETISKNEFVRNATYEMNKALDNLILFSKAEDGLDLPSIREIVPGSKGWEIREKIRDVIRECIKLGMMNLDFIQQYAVFYGAIPDPGYDWKYYFLPNLDYACWYCGDPVMSMVMLSNNPAVSNEILSGDIEFSEPFCINCESIPLNGSAEEMDKVEKEMDKIKRGAEIIQREIDQKC